MGSKTMALQDDEKIGFIGAGNMAQAIANGFISQGLLEPSQIWVSAPSDRNLQIWRTWGCNVTHDNGLLPSTCSWVFLAVKPQEMKSVMDRLRCSPGSAVTTRIWISVAAGISSSTLLKMLSDGQLGRQLIRAMPNTAVLLKCGCVTYSTDIQDDSITRSFETLMKPLGLCVRVPEGQMNATCALSGSGIAFLLMALEALSDGGVKMGLPRALSSQLAAQTMMGAAQLALTAVEPPAILRERVSSPGGTTMAGLHALEKGAFRSVLIDAVEAATRKGEELSSSSLVNSNS